MTEKLTRDVRVEVTRDLDLADVVRLGLGAMVGAGIFVLLIPATQISGTSTILALAFSAVVVLISAASYAELATVYPRQAGGYLWAKESLPPPSGFLTGWIAWAGHASALALSAASLSAFVLFGFALLLDSMGLMNLDSLLGDNTYLITLKVCALLLIFGFLSYRQTGTRVRARRIPLTLILKVGLILIFLAAVPITLLLSHPQSSLDSFEFLGTNGWAGIPLAMALTFVAFEGYEIIAMSSLEIKNPEKTIPRGILISVGLVAILYTLLQLSLLSLARYECTSSLVSCVAITDVRGELGLAILSTHNMTIVGGILIVLAGLAAMTAAVGNNLSSASRLSYDMSRDGALPIRLTDASNGGTMPNKPLLVSGLFAIIFVLILDIPQLAMAASIFYLILFAFVNTSLISLRRRQKAKTNGFRVPFVPFLPILGICINLSLAVSLGLLPVLDQGPLPPGHIAWYIVLLWLTIGLFYHFFSGGKKLLSKAEDKKRIDLSDLLAPSEMEIDLKKYRVVVPLKDIKDTGIVKFGAQIAKERKGELSLLNVVEIPRNLPPRAIRFSYVNDRIKELERLTHDTRKEGVDVRASVKIGHKVHEIIIDTLMKEDVNLLVLGWRGGRETPGRILGSNVDYLVETAPCDVVVCKMRTLKKKFNRILLVTGPLHPLEGVTDLALILAKNERAEIRLLVMCGHELEVDGAVKDTNDFLVKCRLAGVKINQKTCIVKDFEKEIRRESTDCDRVMISSQPPRGIRRYALSPMEHRMARTINRQVLLFRKGG